jgi:hypothetical protein
MAAHTPKASAPGPPSPRNSFKTSPLSFESQRVLDKCIAFRATPASTFTP